VPARHGTTIGTQNPVLILLREASLLNLTMNWIWLMVIIWCNWHLGKILPHNWVPYDVFSAKIICNWKEQVPGGISPEWQLRLSYETEGEGQKLSWVTILLTLRNGRGRIVVSRLFWPYEAEKKAQNLSWVTYVDPMKLRRGTWFEPLLSVAVSKNSRRVSVDHYSRLLNLSVYRSPETQIVTSTDE